MSDKQTIIILHYKYTVSRLRGCRPAGRQAPAPTAAGGRVHYTRRGGALPVPRIRRGTRSVLFPPVPVSTFFSRFITRASLFFTLAASTRDSSQNTVYSTLDIPVFLEGSCPRILINALSIYLSLSLPLPLSLSSPFAVPRRGPFCLSRPSSPTSRRGSGVPYQTDRIARHRGV